MQELLRMQSMGVISRVDQPSPWCAGMIVVLKKNGTTYMHMRGLENVE